jgi:hypothetical protein
MIPPTKAGVHSGDTFNRIRPFWMLTMMSTSEGRSDDRPDPPGERGATDDDGRDRVEQVVCAVGARGSIESRTQQNAAKRRAKNR